MENINFQQCLEMYEGFRDGRDRHIEFLRQEIEHIQSVIDKRISENLIESVYKICGISDMSLQDFGNKLIQEKTERRV